MKCMIASLAIKRFIVAVSLSLLLFCLPAEAQDQIPLGQWRLHLSYNSIQHVEIAPARIFAASVSGIVVYDRREKSLNTYNKLNALSSTGISALGYDAERNQLIVGYESGVLDIIGENSVNTFTRLSDAEITTARKINQVTVHGDLAYLPTAYGVVTFDLRHLEIRETWRDLGAAGETLPVFQTTFLKDSIFLGSAAGVLVGNMNDNLLDFNKWTRHSAGDVAGPVHAIATFNNKVYAAGTAGLYRFTGVAWVQEEFLQTQTIQSLSSSGENLFIISDSSIFALDRTGNLSVITDPSIISPAVVKQDDEGHLWIGDQTRGLVSNSAGTFASYLPNGPSRNTVHRMVYNDGKIFAVAGGFSGMNQPPGISGQLNVFENGSWHTTTLPVSDITDVAFRDNKTFVATFGTGLVVLDAAGNHTFFDETNSPLVNIDGEKSGITALIDGADGIWVANYGGSESLHLLRSDASFQSYSFPYPNAGHPTALAVDGNGDIWMALNPESGGGLIAFDADENDARYKTTAAGQGALPDEQIYSIAPDRDGSIWAGTGEGVAYFIAATEDAIKPIYENRFLLRNEKITAIAVDPGNRKWIGTERGAWLFSPTGETLVHHFTTANSPLLSDNIRDITIHPTTGEVFFGTDRGIISFRSDATDSDSGFGEIRIFPNPVRPGYNGTVGIDGLARDTFVRITDISGKLVWKTQANGGMATWNVRDHRGNRVATGVYLVFASTQDGSESMVGKVAVVE